MTELPEGERLSYSIIDKDGSRQEVIADLTKPFYVGHSSRFRGVDRFGYLPPVLPPATPDDSAVLDELLDAVATLRRQLRRHLSEKAGPIPAPRTQAAGNTLELDK